MQKVFQLSGASLSKASLVANIVLKDGGIVAIPTDTIYGLAVDAANHHAIKRLFNVKGRKCSQALAICLSEIEDIYTYGVVTVPKNLLLDLLPGAVTVMFERTNQLHHALNPTHQLVGIRIPDQDFVRNLCSQLGGPIALTSANISTHPSCLRVDEFQSLWPSIDAIFDGGTLGQIDPHRLGSTIIDLSQAGHYRVVRPGCILENTLHILQRYGLKPCSSLSSAQSQQ